MQHEGRFFPMSENFGNGNDEINISKDEDTFTEGNDPTDGNGSGKSGKGSTTSTNGGKSENNSPLERSSTDDKLTPSSEPSGPKGKLAMIKQMEAGEPVDQQSDFRNFIKPHIEARNNNHITNGKNGPQL